MAVRGPQRGMTQAAKLCVQGFFVGAQRLKACARPFEPCARSYFAWRQGFFAWPQKTAVRRWLTVAVTHCSHGFGHIAGNELTRMNPRERPVSKALPASPWSAHSRRRFGRSNDCASSRRTRALTQSSYSESWMQEARCCSKPPFAWQSRSAT